VGEVAISILEDFQGLYCHDVQEHALGMLTHGTWAEPVTNLLARGRNRFRSATALMAARLVGCDSNVAAVIGAAAEVVHTAIIILDDIADRDQKRRGGASAWAEYGLEHALFAAERAQAHAFTSLFVVDPTGCAADGLAQAVAEVNEGQLAQITCSSASAEAQALFEIGCKKTALGRWSVTAPCTLSAHTALECGLDEYARFLGHAGTIKNDLENVLIDNGYDSIQPDWSQKRMTMPLHLLGGPAALSGRGRGEVQRLLRSSGAYAACKSAIDSAVTRAIECLSIVPEGREKHLLREWALYHREV
jgi:geranylgeranyl pyrophosphate synthase